MFKSLAQSQDFNILKHIVHGKSIIFPHFLYFVLDKFGRLLLVART